MAAGSRAAQEQGAVLGLPRVHQGVELLGPQRQVERLGGVGDHQGQFGHPAAVTARVGTLGVDGPRQQRHHAVGHLGMGLQQAGIPVEIALDPVVSMAKGVAYGITHIVRGEDLRAATETQRDVARAVPELAPFLAVEIQHHALIKDAAGEKLSKSQGSTDLRSLRDAGRGPEDVHAQVGAYLGFDAAFPVTGQTYPRKLDTKVAEALAHGVPMPV